MSNTIITGESLPEIPWEEKTEDNNDPVWRYRDNPIITRKAVTDANRAFARIDELLQYIKDNSH